MTTPRTIPIEIHVAVDSRGKWFAYGSGVKDDSDFRDEAIATFNRHCLSDLDMLGDDAADVEHFTVLAKIPLPDHVLWAKDVKSKQRELFEEKDSKGAET